MKAKTKTHAWAIETKVDSKKYLAWNYRGGKSLYWTSDKKQPVPALFQTRKEAIEAVKKNNKSKEKMPVDLFRNIYDGASQAKPVKVKIQVLN